MTFITAKAEVQQYSKNLYFTKHNQIFQDKEGILHFVPRGFKTDGYTIYDFLAPIAGGRFEEDLRCCIGHDLNCRYQQDIVINLSLGELIEKGLLHAHLKNFIIDQGDILVCEDIPVEFLEIKDIDFWQTNKMFKEMLDNIEIEKFAKWKLSKGVYLNVGWLFYNGRKLNKDIFYKNFI